MFSKQLLFKKKFDFADFFLVPKIFLIFYQIFIFMPKIRSKRKFYKLIYNEKLFRSRKIKKFWRAINERTMAGNKRYIKERIKQKIKLVGSGDRDLAIGIKGPIQEFSVLI